MVCQAMAGRLKAAKAIAGIFFLPRPKLVPAKAGIMLQFVAVIFHHVETFVFDLPARPATGGDAGNAVRCNGQTGTQALGAQYFV